MSNSYFQTQYRCLNDCRQQGCPEHKMVLHVAHTSDTVAVDIDGARVLTLDDNAWSALLTLGEQKPEHSTDRNSAYSPPTETSKT